MDGSIIRNNVDDELIDLVWRDLREAVSRAQVSKMVSEVSEEFHDAKITAFIPIIVRRLSRERLQKELRASSVSARL